MSLVRGLRRLGRWFGMRFGMGIAVAVLANSAWASSGAQHPVLLDADEATRFTQQVQAELARRGARVALVFRTGRTRDRMPDGVAYTHGAFWVYQALQTPDGRVAGGYAVHNLYHEEEDRRVSYLHQDFPIDFIAPTAVNDVGVILPTLEVQRAIRETMASPRYAGLHNPDYSLISNPLDDRFQNCNEFMLDVITAAMYDTDDVERIKEIHRQHFVPTEVRVNLLARIFGPLLDERVRLEDHEGALTTATFASMGDYLRRNGLLIDQFRIEREEAAPGNIAQR